MVVAVIQEVQLKFITQQRSNKYSRLADIKIDPSNNSLTSVYEVDIDVSLPHLATSQVYISVCDNSGGGIESINYDNCLLKAALQSGAGVINSASPIIASH